MRAYVFSRRGELQLKELPVPDLTAIPGGDRGALLCPVLVTPCSSDVHTVFESSGPRRENLVLGHEGLARVIAAGSMVRDFVPGETVAVCAVMPEPEESGAQDATALTGHENAPFSGCKLGRNIEGMWQEVFYVPDADRNLAKLPEGISPMDALMAVDVMATGYSAVFDGEIRAGETVCILGTGAVGLMAAAAAFEAGANVISVGSPVRRLNTELAEHFGAGAVLSYRDGTVLAGSLPVRRQESSASGRSDKANSTSSPAVDAVLDATGGKGADVCIITGGMPESLLQACDLVKYGTGRVVNVSYIEGEGTVELPIFSLGRGMAGKRFCFSLSRGGRAWTEKMLEKAGKLKPGCMVTDTLTGFDSIPEALCQMKEHKPGCIKTAVMIEENK